MGPKVGKYGFWSAKMGEHGTNPLVTHLDPFSGSFFHPQPPSLLILLLESGSERKVLTKKPDCDDLQGWPCEPNLTKVLSEVLGEVLARNGVLGKCSRTCSPFCLSYKQAGQELSRALPRALRFWPALLRAFSRAVWVVGHGTSVGQERKSDVNINVFARRRLQ